MLPNLPRASPLCNYRRVFPRITKIIGYPFSQNTCCSSLILTSFVPFYFDTSNLTPKKLHTSFAKASKKLTPRLRFSITLQKPAERRSEQLIAISGPPAESERARISPLARPLNFRAARALAAFCNARCLDFPRRVISTDAPCFSLCPK